MGRKMAYRVVNCPYCGRRVRRWTDGRHSAHDFTAGDPCPVDSRRCRDCGAEWPDRPPAPQCPICGSRNTGAYRDEPPAWVQPTGADAARPGPEQEVRDG